VLGSETGTSVAQSSTGPRDQWDDADVGVGRTKMIAPSVVGDEPAFLRQFCSVLYTAGFGHATT